MEGIVGNAKQLCQDLETILSNISSSGFDKIDQSIIEKLEKISAEAGVLGMKTGKSLIDNLSGIIKSFKEGKSSIDSVSLRFTALEFYKKNLLDQGAGNEEEL